MFLLFSAEWCHWCKVLESKTLREEKVYQYLNRHFVNIFIDADIHNGIYLKYRATGVPYTVFLNPDQSVYFKYSGVLYAEDFLEVIRGVQENVAVGKSLYGDDEELEAYLPPKEFNLAKLESLHQLLNDGVLDNIDWKHAGLGQGQKTIHPQLLLYLLENSLVEDQEEHLEWIIPALEQAIRHLYDPLEGGFYRYAETREWEVAHFEKMADLNAGMVALLQKVNQLRPTPEFEKTAEQTLKYLVKTLYSEELGVFLSFQEADTFYYFLNAEGRSQGKTPEVIQRIFTDRLSRTLLQLMSIEGIPESFQLDQKILSSLDFLASMVIREKQIYHFYDMQNGQWETPGGLEDLALLSVVFAEAAKKDNVLAIAFQDEAQPAYHLPNFNKKPEDHYIDDIGKLKSSLNGYNGVYRGVMFQVDRGKTFAKSFKEFVGNAFQGKGYLESNNLKKYFSTKHIDKIISFMLKDKKNSSEKINLILLKRIGSPIIDKKFKKDKLKSFLKEELMN